LVRQESNINSSDALALNERLVYGLRSKGYIRTQRVEAAFGAVLRHVFVPGVPLDEAYSDRVISGKKSENGEVLSSSSAPFIMAMMLEQLNLKPGHKVLEIGAGTGYNAALMAHIVGKTGHVVTVDIDQDQVEAAREHLTTAGFDRVRVVCADGGYGYADAAPYDRIILTAGAWDIAPSWWDQMKPDGRLVLPLAIAGQKSIAFERKDDYLLSLSVRDCGFIRLRGAFADPQSGRVVQLGPDPGLEMWVGPGWSPDAETVYELLIGPSRDWDVEATVSVHGIISGLLMWLALNEPNSGRLVARDDMVGRGIVPPLIGLGGARRVAFTPVLYGEKGLAALMRPPGQPAPLVEHSDLFIPGPPFALFVRQFGADKSLAQRLIARIKDWDAAGRPSSEGLQIRAYRRGCDYVPSAGEIVVDKRWTRLVLDWPTGLTHPRSGAR
jgi:protein-L-isoaspartate(D-aspartate) O-methyltransferase